MPPHSPTFFVTAQTGLASHSSDLGLFANLAEGGGRVRVLPPPLSERTELRPDLRRNASPPWPLARTSGVNVSAAYSMRSRRLPLVIRPTLSARRHFQTVGEDTPQ